MAVDASSLRGLHTERWELSGAFSHPHWLAFLGTALAEVGVSVVQGHAARGERGLWEGYLEVDVRAATVKPTELDVAKLAATRPAGADPGPPRLTAAALTRRTDGLLVVDVSAADELGFLGRLLRHVSLFALMPVAVTIATRDGVIDDRLVLAGIGVTAPTPEVVSALEQMLGRFLVP